MMLFSYFNFQSLFCRHLNFLSFELRVVKSCFYLFQYDMSKTKEIDGVNINMFCGSQIQSFWQNCRRVFYKHAQPCLSNFPTEFLNVSLFQLDQINHG